MSIDTGRKIAVLMEQHSISYGELSARTGIAKSALQRYATGQTEKIPIDRLEKIASSLNTTAAHLLGWDNDLPILSNALPVGKLYDIPVIGIVKGGYGGIAYEELEGYELADVKDPSDYFYLRVSGDSMEPQIIDGDLALVCKQDDVESGDIAVVIINGDEGTIKRLIKKGHSIVLQPFNPACPVTVLTGSDLDSVYIVGKVVKTVRNW